MKELKGRPVSSKTSRARTIRRASPEPAGGHRVHGFQPLPQRRRSRRLQFRLQPAADFRVRAGKLQDVQRRADIEPGSAGQDGPLAAAVDVRDQVAGLLLEVRDARFLGHVQDVQEVVRHSPAFGRR